MLVTGILYLSETISTDSDDIKTQKLCIASENDNCATVSTIRSKSCRWFEVYEVPINISCGRLCLGKYIYSLSMTKSRSQYFSADKLWIV